MKANAEPQRKSLGSILEEADWNFCKERVPDREVVASCIWEYARESSFIRQLRQRSLDHWAPLYVKGNWLNAKRDEQLYEDLERVQSIGYAAEVFVRGISCPPDGVLPDAIPLKKGEIESVTGSFPRPWQSLSRNERAYRAHIGTDVERIPLVPFKRACSFDAKDIVQWVESRRREIDTANQAVRRENSNIPEDVLCRQGKLHFESIQPSLYWQGGSEVTVVAVQWEDFTDDEIASYFRKWVQANRPARYPAPSAQGKKLNDWRVALNRLGIMRALHTFTLADHRFPKVFKERGEKHCYTARKLALKKFNELFPFIAKEDKPVSWVTKGRQSK